MTFKYVEEAEIDQAYSILCNRIDELIIKKTGQYVFYYPNKEVYVQRTKDKENWCLIVNSKIVGIVSLSKNNIPKEWSEIVKDNSNYWLSSLFVASDEKGHNYGRILLNECFKKSKENNIKKIYLDCYMDSNFLVPYYEQHGFIKIEEKEFKYKERIFNAALMMFSV